MSFFLLSALAILSLTLGQSIQGDCPDYMGVVYFPDPDCTKFWYGANGQASRKSCPADLYFNAELKVCDLPDNSKCVSKCLEEDKSPCSCDSTTECPNRTTSDPVSSSTVAPVPSSSQAPDGEDSCDALSSQCPAVDGPHSVYIPLSDCTKFCQCSNGKAYQHSCSGDLHFNPNLNVCDYPERANCSGASGTTFPAPAPSNPTEAPASNSSEAADGEDSCDALSSQCPAVDGPHSVYIPLSDCTKFCQCSNGKAYQHSCSGDLHFNPNLNVCDYPEKANCSGASGTTVPAPAPSNPTEAPASNSSEVSDGEDSCDALSSQCPAVDGPHSVYIPLSDCTKFCQCSNGKAYQHSCSGDLHFNPNLNVCDYPEKANCSGASGTTVPAPAPSNPTEAPASNSSEVSDGEDSCDALSSQCPAVDGSHSVYIPLSDCTKFCQCSNGKAYQHSCSGDLHFNPNLNVCDYPERANCSGPSGTTVPAPAPSSSTEVPASNSSEVSDGEDFCDALSSQCPAVDGPHSVYIPLPDCTKFCQCSNGKAYQHSCSGDLHFNPNLNVCDYPEKANCSGASSTTVPAPAPSSSTETSASNSSEVSDAEDSCDALSSQCPAVDGPHSVYIPLSDCTKFCQCSNGKAYQHSCSGDLHFNPNLNVCDYPERANCSGASGTTVPAPAPSNPTEAPPSNSSEAADGEDSCDALSRQCPAVDGPHSVYIPLSDCTKFCQCSNGKAFQHSCPGNLHFNPVKNVCDYPTDAGCNGISDTTTRLPLSMEGLSRILQSWFGLERSD